MKALSFSVRVGDERRRNNFNERRNLSAIEVAFVSRSIVFFVSPRGTVLSHKKSMGQSKCAMRLVAE